MARWAESVLITLFFCLVPQKCYPSIVKNWHATSLMEKLSNKKVWANGKVNGKGWKCVYNIYDCILFFFFLLYLAPFPLLTNAKLNETNEDNQLPAHPKLWCVSEPWIDDGVLLVVTPFAYLCLVAGTSTRITPTRNHDAGLSIISCLAIVFGRFMASGNLNLWFDWSADKWWKRLDARYCCLSLPVRFAAHIVRMYARVSFFFDGFKVKTNVTD